MSAPIAIQLYTLREQAAHDLPGLIERLGKIGFRGVETFFSDTDPRALANWIRDAGMVVTSAHALPLGEDAEKVLDAVSELGAPTVIVPAIGPERFGTREEVCAVAEELSRASEAAARHGLALGYHNHFWEWTALADGGLAYDVLFAEMDASVLAELDVYWAQVAGQDPVAVLRQLGPRARLLHMKDGPADEPASAMTAAGEGKVDLAGIAAAARAADWHIVELDRCDSDMWEAVARSYAHLTSRGISEGSRG
jgi:sugar phosphate isomerase/epimerase